jgi:uncharacterized protein (TIGR03435 family)
MRIVLGLAISLGFLAYDGVAQSFDVASVKPSARAVGKDYRGAVVFGPERVSARNVSLKGLIVEAYHVQPFQVSGEPGWLDLDEFDVDAHAGGPTGKDELRSMLVALLGERFHLTLHRDLKEMRVYALLVDKGGPKLHPATEELRPSTSPQNFHGDMRQFANMISIGLSIPTVEDPTRPAVASGPPAPVVDKTGLEGDYDISVNLRPDDAGGDSFTRWQRALRDQLGLKLESQRAAVEVLVVDSVERMPTAN